MLRESFCQIKKTNHDTFNQQTIKWLLTNTKAIAANSNNNKPFQFYISPGIKYLSPTIVVRITKH
jgi:hypothetical protein